MEGTGNRGAEILTTDYRMNADRGLEPKLINPERALESSGNNQLRALRAATGERGKRANFKFLTVRDLISAWTGGGYGNAEGAARGHRGCGARPPGGGKMHEMMKSEPSRIR